MLQLINIATLVTIILCLTLMGAAVANIQNVFREKKEDNTIFNLISFIPRKTLQLLGIRQTYMGVGLVSILLFIALVTLNQILIVLLG